MHHIPVLRGYDRHAADRKIFIHLIKSRGGPAPSAADDSGGRLIGEAASDIKHSIQKRSDGSGQSGVMHRRAKNIAVRFFRPDKGFIYHILRLDTGPVQLLACSASKAACYGFISYPENLRINSFFFQYLFRLTKRCVGTSLLMRASVYQ